MQKKPGIWTWVAMGCGTVVFGGLWLNNLVAAVFWHWRLFCGDGAVSSGAGGCSWLAWSALDVSTVTTFVPFFGFLLMWIGLRKPGKREDWPFFDGYERLNIALGLLGTIWGIILIGFYPVGAVTIQALMYCLHTAMFSTLAAVAWVMVLLPLVFRPWLNAVRQGAAGADAEMAALEESVDRLLAGVRESGKALTATAAESRAFAAAAGELHAELARLREEFKSGREAESAWRNEALAGIQAFAAVTEELRRQQVVLTEENLQLQERKKVLEGDLAAAQVQIRQFQQQLDAVRNLLR